MAGDDSIKTSPSIPSWQQKPVPDTASSTPSNGSNTNEPDVQPELNTLEHARRFLDDDSIKGASREHKVAFLETKGLKPEQIEDLLSDEPDLQEVQRDGDLRTVHDSTTTVASQASAPATQQAPMQNTSPPEARPPPRTEIPPIITYPEFLLKPQKPPPLVTFDRLANAAYIIAGISALTYGASKYLVQPMLESLTNSRHDLLITAQDSLTKLNSKLETTVSHVPYIPPLHLKHNIDEDTESIDSDPTELFHRDIATQTTPGHSRTSSLSSTSEKTTTDYQATRLASLHSSLQSLLSSTTTHFAEDSLQKTLSNLQTTVSKLNTSSDTYDTSYTSPYSWQNSSTSKSKGSDQDTSQATKFKAEIRSLKGVFLSSRNFPTARPAAPFAIPQR